VRSFDALAGQSVAKQKLRFFCPPTALAEVGEFSTFL
jgi:hypothetical protein